MAQHPTSPNATNNVNPGNSGVPAGIDFTEFINEQRTKLQAAVDNAYEPVREARAQYVELSEQANDLQEKVNGLRKEAQALYSAQLEPFSAAAASAEASLKAFNRKTQYVAAAVALLKLRHLRATDPSMAMALPTDEQFIITQLPMRNDGSGKHVKATTAQVAELTTNINQAVEFVQAVAHQQ